MARWPEVEVGMGNRPYAKVVYGFAIDIDDYYEREDEWDEELVRRAGLGPRPSIPGYPRDWSDAERDRNRAYTEKKTAIVSVAARPVRWAYLCLDEPEYIMGIVIAETDWEDALDISGVKVPVDADKRIADACQFFGITPNVAATGTWLVAAYG